MVVQMFLDGWMMGRVEVWIVEGVLIDWMGSWKVQNGKRSTEKCWNCVRDLLSVTTLGRQQQ